jgi:hypothetical protein
MSAEQGGTACALASRHDFIDDCGTPIQRFIPPTAELLEESDPQPVSAAPNAPSPNLVGESYQPADPAVRRRLFRRLLAFRTELAEVWSLKTIHASYVDNLTADQAASTGQCGVSSAWILWRFGRWYRFRAKYCYGDIIHGATDTTFEYHCWIEIGNAGSARRLVIDVTCDQFKVFEDTPVLLDRHARLLGQSIEYRAASRRSFRSLNTDHVWPRFETLRELTNPSTAMERRSTVGGWLPRRGQSTSAVPADQPMERATPSPSTA